MGVFRSFHFLTGNLGQERDVVYNHHFPYRNGISNVKLFNSKLSHKEIFWNAKKLTIYKS